MFKIYVQQAQFGEAMHSMHGASCDASRRDHRQVGKLVRTLRCSTGTETDAEAANVALSELLELKARYHTLTGEEYRKSTKLWGRFARFFHFRYLIRTEVQRPKGNTRSLTLWRACRRRRCCRQRVASCPFCRHTPRHTPKFAYTTEIQSAPAPVRSYRPAAHWPGQQTSALASPGGDRNGEGRSRSLRSKAGLTRRGCTPRRSSPCSSRRASTR